ncbi:MAG: substrate-binding domain-containing protein [Streptosporangiales bacterium]|nr:substrate-binding domain-containing protein [Streptosporangiales bacterium]
MFANRRRLAGAFLALAAGLAVTGCASTDEPVAKDTNADELVVGYSQSNNAEPYRAQLNIQLQHYMKRYPKLKLLPITDAQQDSGKQVSQVQNFITNNVDVLIVSPNESAPLTPPVEKACQKDIPVIILDRTVNTDCYSSFIGGDNVEAGRKAGELAAKELPDGGNVEAGRKAGELAAKELPDGGNVEAGRKAGELAAKELPDGGNVVVLQGILSNQPQIDRLKGFEEGIESNSKIKVIKKREAKWLKPDATRIMNQWLAQDLDIDLVYAENDPMALGAYQAAAGKGMEKDIEFIGTDGLAIPDGGIRAVQQGKLVGTFIYPTGAEEAAKTANALAQGKKVQKEQVLGIPTVTQDNAAGLYKKYDFSDEG